jgi:hypothetical protein
MKEICKINSMEDDKYVYHGSNERFEEVVPKRNKRIRISKTTGIQEIIFDEVSFHATPYIASSFL